MPEINHFYPSSFKGIYFWGGFWQLLIPLLNSKLRWEAQVTSQKGWPGQIQIQAQISISGKHYYHMEWFVG